MGRGGGGQKCKVDSHESLSTDGDMLKPVLPGLILATPLFAVKSDSNKQNRVFLYVSINSSKFESSFTRLNHLDISQYSE